MFTEETLDQSSAAKELGVSEPTRGKQLQIYGDSYLSTCLSSLGAIICLSVGSEKKGWHQNKNQSSCFVGGEECIFQQVRHCVCLYVYVYASESPSPLMPLALCLVSSLLLDLLWFPSLNFFFIDLSNYSLHVLKPIKQVVLIKS